MKNTLKEKLLPLYSKFDPSDISRLSVFNVQIGDQWKENESILFVGKAVNGWNEINSITELFSEYDASDILSWLEDNSDEYNPKSSAFWRVIKKVERNNSNISDNWYEKIAWSNLCKLAPKQGGNPNNADFEKQKDICREILLTEIDILKPKAVILFTSDWDILDLERDEPIAEEFWGNYSSSLYRNNDIYYIHTVHPQGKKEDEHVNAICKLLNKIEYNQ